MFRNRAEAAVRLAQELDHFRGANPLVLGVPRGGVPMARTIADALEGELDVVLVHKIGSPENPEFAIGAVSEDGTVELRGDLGVGPRKPWLEDEIERQLKTLRERRRTYSSARSPIDPAGRTVIVVDDGAATGATLMMALELLRKREPERLVVALAVAPPDTVERLEEIADEVVCLQVPRLFFAVGQYFHEFEQVTDDEVIQLLGGDSDD
ncbi:MAG: phosphoribosyltransferase family protein [Halofilum sp. (in: g-proteobacteria)]|nr:phosphoribosyltransferase family protein [Halofilum sp. (in: g-proteobacteria)]